MKSKDQKRLEALQRIVEYRGHKLSEYPVNTRINVRDIMKKLSEDNKIKAMRLFSE